MWQTELGVTVNLSNQDWNVFLKSRKDGDFQIARNGWIADYNDPCSFLDMWYTGGGNNDAQYSNPEYDALIDAAKLHLTRLSVWLLSTRLRISLSDRIAFLHRSTSIPTRICCLITSAVCTTLRLDISSSDIPSRTNDCKNHGAGRTGNCLTCVFFCPFIETVSIFC